MYARIDAALPGEQQRNQYRPLPQPAERQPLAPTRHREGAQNPPTRCVVDRRVVRTWLAIEQSSKGPPIRCAERATTIAAVIAAAGLTSGGATACSSDMTADEAALAKEAVTVTEIDALPY